MTEIEQLILYGICLVVACSYAYRLGRIDGNEKGFQECSNIWQSKYIAPPKE